MTEVNLTARLSILCIHCMDALQIRRTGSRGLIGKKVGVERAAARRAS